MIKKKREIGEIVMILMADKIKQLNKYMVGISNPDIKDFTGYNRPDTAKMMMLARYTGEYDNGLCLAVLKTLNRYKSTQLVSHKEDITESIEYYKQQNADIRKSMYNLSVESSSNFIPEEIEYIGYKVKNNNTYVNLKWTSMWYDKDAYMRTGSMFAEKKESGWCMSVPFSDINNLISFLRYKGKYGYVPSKELQQFVKDYKEPVVKFVKDYKEPVVKKNKLELIEVTKEGWLFYYDGYSKDVNDLKLKYKKDSLRSIKKGDKWNTFVAPDALDDFLNALKSSYELIPKDELLKKYNEWLEKEKEKNKSKNTLINLDNYNLPFKPYDFQIEDAKKIISKKRMLLGHDMGCGKTFIATIVGTSIDTPKLVICPESLRLNWEKEIKNVTPDADVRVLYSKDEFETGNDWTIIGFATAVKFRDNLLEENIKCVFVDEAHNCKAIDNYGKPASKRAEAVLAICGNAEYCYPMTGTPIPTRTKDLYNIFTMLKEDAITDKGFFDYGIKYCNGLNNGFGWDFNGNSNNSELNEILNKRMVRRLKKDVLPNLKKQRLFITTRTKSRKYKKIEKELETGYENNDTFMSLAMTGRNILSKEKVSTAIDLANSILDEDKSVVIVSNFSETLDKIQKTYGNDCCCIRGEMTDEQKQKAIDDFQSGKKKVCALNIIAGGVGVTLTKSNNMIICDYDWTPSNMSQVEDRICRSGQNSDYCNIYYVYCENAILDKIFIDMITNKSSNINQIIDTTENTMDFTNNKKNATVLSVLKAKYKAEGKKRKKSRKKKEEIQIENE